MIKFCQGKPDGPHDGWIRSTRSRPGNNCVEVKLGQCRVMVRDSKNLAGPVLHLNWHSWRAFLTCAAGDSDHNREVKVTCWGRGRHSVT